jgi:hypothetical protein
VVLVGLTFLSGLLLEVPWGRSLLGSLLRIPGEDILLPLLLALVLTPPLVIAVILIQLTTASSRSRRSRRAAIAAHLVSAFLAALLVSLGYALVILKEFSASTILIVTSVLGTVLSIMVLWPRLIVPGDSLTEPLQPTRAAQRNALRKSAGSGPRG